MIARRRIVWVCLAVLCAAAAPVSADDLETQRLEKLGRLWGLVEHLHPKLAYADIDWDAAVVECIPKVRAAKTKDEYAAAIRDMLSVLDDGASGVDVDVAGSAAVGARSAAASSSLGWAGKDDKVLVVTVRGEDFAGVFAGLGMLGAELPKARAIVFDLRDARDSALWAAQYLINEHRAALTSKPLTLPTYRERVTSGYPPQTMGTSGGYYTAFQTAAAEVVEPAEGSSGKRVVFVGSKDTPLPMLALAMQETRQGAIVIEGSDEYSLVDATQSVDMGEGVTARFLTTELVHGDESPTLRADRRVAARAAGKDSGTAAALELAQAKSLPRRRAKRGPKLPPARWKRDRTYADMSYPEVEYRLLALYRMWNVIELFYPYDHLIDWDGALADYIPQMIAAGDETEYAKTVMEMATRIADGHTHVGGGVADAIRGEATIPVSIRFFEHQPVVELIDDSAVKKAGLAVGDVVVALDGKPIREVMRARGRLVPASHRVAWGYSTARDMLRGPKDSAVTLTVKGADGKARDVDVKRTRTYQMSWRDPDTSYRLLDEHTGYAHLGALTPGEVDAMFVAFKDADAIIFDLRNYPQGTAWSIAPRINEHPWPTYGALFQRRLVQPSGGEEMTARFQFQQPIPKSEHWKYKGRIVVLIDERAISQSEHTALFFEAATDPVFIGTKTAGANGDVTNLCIPGGLCVTFTGHDVRHADGRQLQRVGIQPDIRVRPTIADVRAGRDRVLERARKYLERERSQAKPAPRSP
jgi:C-terminal processing protease CtpA/Prc